MARIGVISMSDGRDYVHGDVVEFVRTTEKRLVQALTRAGHEVVTGREPVWTNEMATSVAREVAASSPDVTVLHYAVWAFPHFSMLAAGATPGPLVLLSNIDPVYPGMVGMLAAGGALDQIGRAHRRLWGDPGSDPGLVAAIGVQARAAAAVAGLRGSTFGRIGGRPMGMNTATANTDQWQKLFGVDVEEIDQWEIVRRAELADAAEADKGRAWLEDLATVHYDGNRLTPEILDRQVRSYLAMRELVEEWRLDFTGIKGQPELTQYFATMDVTEALLNDPYDWDRAEADHGVRDRGGHGRRADHAAAEAGLRRHAGALRRRAALPRRQGRVGPVQLRPARHLVRGPVRRPGREPREGAPVPGGVLLPAGGASVHHLAAPGRMTLARLTRRDGNYRMHLMAGEFESYDDETNEAMMRQSTYEWPHAFARLDAPAEDFLARFGANHIHAIPGDHRAELRATCELLGLELDEFTRR